MILLQPDVEYRSARNVTGGNLYKLMFLRSRLLWAFLVLLEARFVAHTLQLIAFQHALYSNPSMPAIVFG